MLQVEMPQADKGYLSIRFTLDHETILTVYLTVVVVEHPDIFFPLLDNKISGDQSLVDVLRAAEQGRHQGATCASPESVYSQIQSGLQLAAGLDDIFRVEGIFEHVSVLQAVIELGPRHRGR